jgi:hypothetical protein
MNGRKSKLGSNHPDTLSSMANLAATYWKQGKLDAAHSLLFPAVETMQLVTGTQHPIVLHYIKELDQLSKERQHK